MVGIIGFLLPPVLVVGRWLLDGPGLQTSLSAYYYTSVRDVFVGSMCAVAMFMFSYRGYERQDDIAGDVACISALGIALFPIRPAGDETARAALIGNIHFASAIVFFLSMAYFALVLFRKTDRPYPTPQKLKSNRVYTISGWLIVACVVLIFLLSFVDNAAAIKRLSPVFWLETVAIVAFGIAWLTKGEAILQDKEY